MAQVSIRKQVAEQVTNYVLLNMGRTDPYKFAYQLIVEGIRLIEAQKEFAPKIPVLERTFANGADGTITYDDDNEIEALVNRVKVKVAKKGTRRKVVKEALIAIGIEKGFLRIQGDSLVVVPDKNAA